jgi:hypothetical protein
MRVLFHRPFCSCDDRRVNPRYLSAVGRYTTHLVRYGGYLAPHSHLRNAIIPTPRQQGVDGEETQRGTSYWPWARLLGRVFALEMATCPWCRRGTLRLIAAITQESVITRILRHLQLASIPRPLPRPVLATPHAIGSPKPTTARVGSYATCAPWRWLHTSARVHSRPRASLSVFPHCLQRAMATGGRRWSTRARWRTRALKFLSTGLGAQDGARGDCP